MVFNGEGLMWGMKTTAGCPCRWCSRSCSAGKQRNERHGRCCPPACSTARHSLLLLLLLLAWWRGGQVVLVVRDVQRRQRLTLGQCSSGRGGGRTCSGWHRNVLASPPSLRLR